MNDRHTLNRRRPHATVCLCWVHPLTLTDFRRLLLDNGLGVCERRLTAAMARDGDSVRTPRASVYVVEAHPDAALTETLVARILASRPGARILAVAERFEPTGAFPLLRLGVKGLLRFDEAPPHLGRAVREILQDGIWVSRSLLSRFIDSTVRSLNPRNPRLLLRGEALSRREHEVCGLLMENLSNREIANRLHVSERTAKFHVANLLAKYGLKRRTDLVLLSYAQSRDRALTARPRTSATAARTP
jgi:DNA-binding NarL/FixJ family response regulator